MNIAMMSGAFLLVAWVVLAFVAALPSGWVHLPLALGVILVAKGIVDREERD